MVFVKEIEEKYFAYSGIPINRKQTEKAENAADNHKIKQFFIVPLDRPLCDGRLNISIFFFSYEIKKEDAENFRKELWELQKEVIDKEIIEAQV